MISKIFPRWSEEQPSGPTWNFKQWNKTDFEYAIRLGLTSLAGLIFLGLAVASLLRTR